MVKFRLSSQSNNKETKQMTYWANAAKDPSTVITSEKNLQKLGGKLMETNARIDFDEACYFVGENQDSFAFNPTTWTDVKGAQGYVPTLTPSLIHFVRKEHKGYQGATKEVTPKDLFFTKWLSGSMNQGKFYYGFIDTSIPEAMMKMIDDPANANVVLQLLSPYINLVEKGSEINYFSGLTVSESKLGGKGFSGGYSAGEAEADKIKARQEAIKAIAVELYGENAKPIDHLDKEKFLTYCSLSLGLSLPSGLTLTF